MMKNHGTNYVVTNITGTTLLELMGFITWLVFLVLKVTGIWAIPWFWVWFPLWFPLAVGIFIFLVTLIVIFIIVLIAAKLDK